MKLVTILAKELAQWPVGYSRIVQTAREGVLPIDDEPVEFDGGQWDYVIPTMRIYDAEFAVSELAEDNDTAIVTRGMWEAERIRIAEPVVWNGYGLPPVGETVIASIRPSKYRCTVVGYNNGLVVCAMPDDYEDGCYDGIPTELLSPLQSTREKWIEAAIAEREGAGGSLDGWMGRLFDKGLAKLPECAQ